jgi:Acetoacetate decarboxylase (ADC)
VGFNDGMDSRSLQEVIAAVPGVPETTLPEEVLVRLPESTPPPPWTLATRAVVWAQRSAVPLPAGSPYRDRTLSVTLASVVEYVESPFGPYHEVFAGVLLAGMGRPRLHIPFIAVDSTASLHAGRLYLSLPKAMASFTGDPRRRVVATGESWSVEVEVSSLGPPLPLVVPFVAAQPGLTAPATVRGIVRPAAVRVAARGATLGGWLGEGRHAGFVARGHIDVGAARPSAE